MVKALLIGEQACLLYGAAEFSRDIDLSPLITAENLEDLREVLKELEAEPVFYLRWTGLSRPFFPLF